MAAAGGRPDPEDLLPPGHPFFYLQEHFLRGLEVADLGELEQRLAQFLEQYNARPHSTTGRAPVDLFPQENLRPLVPVLQKLFYPDQVIVAAIIDRLVHHSQPNVLCANHIRP
ncbi:MAG: hypothetical protein FJ135_03850 [Deltaproteobacteria bacterium]|nr:hypothetical protein [Deltaproteobacteria bacterium]